MVRLNGGRGVSLLHHLDRLPPAFARTPARRLHELLPGPTLVHLPGERPAALFVSILQHGNEVTGLEAVQQLLRDHGERPLPRAMSLFIANVEAASAGRRRLEHQPDYNRCWPGTEHPESPETAMMRQVVDEMRRRPLFASVDIHNTTGDNPHHAAVNTLDHAALDLARRFARTVVYFTRPRGAQARAFAELCPAVILECGRVGNADGRARASEFLEYCLDLESVPDAPPRAADIDLFESVALVHVPQAVRFRFGPGAHAELMLDAELDRFNFHELPAGTSFGHVRGAGCPVRAVAPDGAEATDRFFRVEDGQLRLRRPVMPSLLTRDPRIVRQDCLCHLLERIDLA